VPKLASIVAGVFQVWHSHAEEKKYYESKINRDELIKVTIGLAEPMREREWHGQVPLDEPK
jgi:hypothetical protein